MCSNACIFGITFGVMWGVIGLIVLFGYVTFLCVGNPYSARRGDKQKKKRAARLAAEEEEEEVLEVIQNEEDLTAHKYMDPVKASSDIKKSNEPAESRVFAPENINK